MNLNSYLRPVPASVESLRATPNPLMQFISSLDLVELSNSSSQAEQPARPASKKIDSDDLWAK